MGSKSSKPVTEINFILGHKSNTLTFKYGEGIVVYNDTKRQIFGGIQYDANTSTINVNHGAATIELSSGRPSKCMGIDPVIYKHMAIIDIKYNVCIIFKEYILFRWINMLMFELRNCHYTFDMQNIYVYYNNCWATNNINSLAGYIPTWTMPNITVLTGIEGVFMRRHKKHVLSCNDSPVLELTSFNQFRDICWKGNRCAHCEEAESLDHCKKNVLVNIPGSAFIEIKRGFLESIFIVINRKIYFIDTSVILQGGNVYNIAAWDRRMLVDPVTDAPANLSEYSILLKEKIAVKEYNDSFIIIEARGTMWKYRALGGYKLSDSTQVSLIADPYIRKFYAVYIAPVLLLACSTFAMHPIE